MLCPGMRILAPWHICWPLLFGCCTTLGLLYYYYCSFYSFSVILRTSLLYYGRYCGTILHGSTNILLIFWRETTAGGNGDRVYGFISFYFWYPVDLLTSTPTCSWLVDSEVVALWSSLLSLLLLQTSQWSLSQQQSATILFSCQRTMWCNIC